MGAHELLTGALCIAVGFLFVLTYSLQRQIDILVDIAKIFDKWIEKSYEKTIWSIAEEKNDGREH